MAISNETAPPGRLASPDLTPEFQRARARLGALRRPTRAAKQSAWDLLLTWQRQLKEQHGLDLPPPWIFSNEEGEVEFEWERGARQLTLTLGASISYAWSDDSGGQDRDEEGAIDVDEVQRRIHALLA